MNNTKVKGNIGELAIAKRLVEDGYYVFTELGDSAPIDLIAVKREDPTEVVRLQVKYSSIKKNGNVALTIHNGGRGSSKRSYTEDDFDVYAIYIHEKDLIIFVPLSEVLANKSGAKEIKVDTPKLMTKRVCLASDYLMLGSSTFKLGSQSFTLQKRE